MIKSEIKLSSTNKPIITQTIKVICDECGKEWDSALIYQIKGRENYNKDLCRGCKQRAQYKQGLRKDQSQRAGEGYSKKYKGKTLEEIVGTDNAIIRREKISNATTGKKNPNYGGIWHGINPAVNQKGKTIDELYGKEKANRIRVKLSKASSGENNPMYGKPSPRGSGNGWSGWYKGWYFRSLNELSYMINVIERFNLSWESAERKKYRIEYKDFNGTNRTYYPDFLIDEKYLVEIKPKKLWQSDNVKRKKEAAIEFCKNKNLKYKLTQSIKTLTFSELKILVENNEIKFTERYIEKFEVWEKES
jgi:hypothetical protein